MGTLGKSYARRKATAEKLSPTFDEIARLPDTHFIHLGTDSTRTNLTLVDIDDDPGLEARFAGQTDNFRPAAC